MSDLVERLRAQYCTCHESYVAREMIDPMCESCSTQDAREEAADEIERLRTMLRFIKYCCLDCGPELYPVGQKRSFELGDPSYGKIIGWQWLYSGVHASFEEALNAQMAKWPEWEKDMQECERAENEGAITGPEFGCVHHEEKA